MLKLFSLGVTLYLVFGFDVNEDIFSYEDVAHFWTKLASIGFCDTKSNEKIAFQVSAILNAFNLSIVDGCAMVEPKKNTPDTDWEEAASYEVIEIRTGEFHVCSNGIHCVGTLANV